MVLYLRSEKRNIPYLPVFSLFFLAYYGLPIFLNYDMYTLNMITPSTIKKCLFFSLAGYIVMMIGFSVNLGTFIKGIIKPLSIPWDFQKAYRLGLFVGFLGITVHYITFDNGIALELGAVVSFLIDLSRLGIAILFMLQLQDKLKFRGKIMLWGVLFPLRVGLDLASGFNYPIIFDFLLLFFLYFYHHKTIPWVRIIAVLTAIFFIFSVKSEFRRLTWQGEYVKAQPLEKLALYGKLIVERINGTHEEGAEEAYQHLLSRSDYLFTFAKVVDLTPAYVPYWNGYTLRTLITNFIPRFLMPDKPKKTLGNEFGQRYGLLDSPDMETSYNLPIIIEMYANFGFLGVTIGMFILGAIFRTLYILLNHENAGEGGHIIGAMIFLYLMTLEADFSLVFGAIIQYIVLFYLIIRKIGIHGGRKEHDLQ